MHHLYSLKHTHKMTWICMTSYIYPTNHIYLYPLKYTDILIHTHTDAHTHIYIYLSSKIISNIRNHNTCFLTFQEIYSKQFISLKFQSLLNSGDRQRFYKLNRLFNKTSNELQKKSMSNVSYEAMQYYIWNYYANNSTYTNKFRHHVCWKTTNASVFTQYFGNKFLMISLY